MQLQVLIDLARDPEVAARRYAMLQLAQYPVPESIAILVQGLSDVAPVMDAAVHSLILIGGHQAARAVAPLLSEPQLRIRSIALDVLRGLGAGAGPVLIELLEHPNRDVRKMAAELLAQSRYLRANDALTHALDDPDPVVRAAAVEALLAADREGAPAALLSRWPVEPDEWVRIAIVMAVTRVGTEFEVQRLLCLAGEGSMLDLVRSQLSARPELAHLLKPTGGDPA